MNNKNIVWGACWFNEPIDIVINFFQKTEEILSSMGYKVYPVIFDAKLDHDVEDNKKIYEKIKDVLIIQNSINIYPNKNYGVATISKYAHKINSKYTAIVDPDWDIKEYNSFISIMLKPLENEDADIVIPDICKEAGRSNLLIGKVAISLFYPEYIDIIKTPFPGSLIGLTNEIYKITSSSSYHFDWGGEWDVISMAIQNSIKITSLSIEVKNIRHRPNVSKILDAFQIWRAILSSENIVKRYKNLIEYNKKIIPFDNISEKILSGNFSINEQINIINTYAENDTQRQLLYMLLYPIALVLGEMNDVPEIEQKGDMPYDKEKIIDISNLAIYCLKMALENSNMNILEINKKVKVLKGYLWSDWDQKSQQMAINKYEEDLINGG